VRISKFAACSIVIAIVGGGAAAYLATVTVPWQRWRYSLLTLVIVTTLVAVVLGLPVYLFQR
jgi:hypothetical protein